jgi:Sec7-like guanine-nucleotide exchange factor
MNVQETLVDKIIISSLFIILIIALATAPDVFIYDTKIAYDCRLASYPTAIDIPQAVIQQCRNQQKEHHGN